MNKTAKPKACPKCGNTPRILNTLTGRLFVACLEHMETKACPTAAQAIALWNAGEYEHLPPSPARCRSAVA